MTTQVSTKVRLVRCPKCRQVLAELPEVLLYKCGGCGTVLQAKNRKVETNSAELSSQETNSVSKSRQDDVLVARSSNNDFVSPPNVESSLDKDNIRCKDENGDSVELCEDRSISNGLSSSPEVTCPPNEDLSIEAYDFSKHNSLGRNSKRYHKEFRDDNGEWTGGGNFSDELPSSGEYTLEDEVYTPEASELVEQHNKSHLHQDNRVLQESDNFLSEHEDKESVLLPEGIKDDYVPPENDENSRIGFTDRIGEIKPANENDIVSQSQSAEQNIEADDGAEGRLIFRREKNTNASIGDSIVSCQSPSKESLVSFYLSSPDNEHLNRFSRGTTCNFGRASSVDTLGTANYPKTESYYAYDGSESSYDGTDDQIRENISRPSRKNKDVDISTADMLGKNSEPERSYWATSSSHRAMENLANNRNRTRLDKQEGISRLPFASRDPHTSYRHSSLPPRPGFNSSVKPSYSEPDRIDLLRTVCELKDQLNRMQFPEVRRFPAGAVDGKFASFQYDHLTPEREIYSDVNHPHGYTLRHNQAKNVSRMAFSGEAPHYRHQVSCSCLHCCPQDWRYSAQLPSHTMHGKNRHRGVHSDQSCCNSSSPQHYTSSEISLWGHETKSDDQRHDEIKRLRLKEKYHAAKRHLRPVAGGAPVVACYHCSELLHLPADFLLFKKKYHRLMCNACKKVLRFSLLRGTHIVPYVPEASAPPPSEANEYNGATSRRNLKPVSRSSSGRHVETVSCSDDYGRSFCSTEGEGSVIERNSYNRKMSSGSSYEPIEDRKMKSVLREPRDENESLLEPVEAVVPSSKWRKGSSEIESSSNSPLHRLMGYPSLSQVLDK